MQIDTLIKDWIEEEVSDQLDDKLADIISLTKHNAKEAVKELMTPGPIECVPTGSCTGQSWSYAEEKTLEAAFQEFLNVQAIKRERSSYAIKCRLEKMAKDGII